MTEDRAVSVRDGETLDLAALTAYLTDHLPGFTGPLHIKQFPGGFSNLTYLLQAGEREWVLRRPPFGANIKSAHDMGREYGVLNKLHAHYPCPTPRLYCDDTAVIGAPFYVMDRVRGVILRQKPPAELHLDEPTMAKLSATCVTHLARLHRLEPAAVGMADMGKPAGYVERQVTGWAGRYAKAKTDAIPSVERAAAWLCENPPTEVAARVIHNDFKYDNLVLDPDDLGQVRAVLDWEMATVGDPLMDLGTCLGYWAEASDPPVLKGFGLTSLPGNWNRRQVLEHYQQETGIQVERPVFYFVFGMVKLAVIAQQIYARFKAGHTKDPRFGALIHVVRGCGTLAAAAIDKGRIDDLLD